jgi:hypothetical protein
MERAHGVVGVYVRLRRTDNAVCRPVSQVMRTQDREDSGQSEMTFPRRAWRTCDLCVGVGWALMEQAWMGWELEGLIRRVVTLR